MENIVVIMEGSRRLLDFITAQALASADLKVGLFTADVDPTEGDSSADYTAAEADFDDYARLALTGWTAAAANGARQQTNADVVSFACALDQSTPNDVYGWFVIDETDATVILAQRFPGAPLRMEFAGDTIEFIPFLQMRSEFVS